MNTIFAVYRKANKVIDSCENKKQLVGAKKYTNYFFHTFAKLVGYSRHGFREYLSDDLLTEMYKKLQKKIIEKRNSLNEV